LPSADQLLLSLKNKMALGLGKTRSEYAFHMRLT
jgi:hypothetical protein